MIKVICTLLLASAVAAPPASAQAPVRKAPLVTIDPPAMIELQQEIDNALEKTHALEEVLRNHELKLHLDRDAHREIEMMAMTLAELAIQVPVPPAVPLSPEERDWARKAAREAREKREEERRKQPKRRTPAGSVESTEPFTRSFKVGRGASLIVSNMSGNIQVSPGGNDQIEVHATKRGWGANADQAKQRLADATIEPYVNGNRVELRVEQVARKDGRGLDVDFDVKVPADASVELRTASGDLRITNVKGEIRAQAVSGNVALDGTPRVVVAKSVSGDITLGNAGADAQLSVSTVSGNVIATTLAARSLDVTTVSGDVRISAWSGDRAVIKALSGNVNLETSVAKAGRYEIEAHSGDVHLSLPEQAGFDLESHTFSGRIRVDFPIKSEGPVRESGFGPRSVRGVYGDGSSSLRVQTFSGNLTIARK